jgi:hypothetical protein
VTAPTTLSDRYAGRRATAALRPALAICAAIGLAACAGGESALAPPCPDIVVVRDIASATQFKPGAGRDLTDVVLEATIAGFDGFCETDLDEGETGEVTVELRLVFSVSRGPANAERKGAFSYFVAVADRNDNPVRKHVFDSEVEFPGNRNRIAPFEELALQIPLKPGENGADYNVLIGFQLTPEQLEYNRSQGVR